MSRCHCCAYGHTALLGIETIARGVDEPAGVGTIWSYAVRLNTVVVCTAGLAAGSSDSALASLPLVCSKNTPYPPRIAVLPSPFGSQAKPIRGAGLNKWPFMQLSGTPWVTPHCTTPLNGFPTTRPV